MAQYNFGAGNFFVVPSGDCPTPVQLGTLQEVSVDFSGSNKTLTGQYQFAAAVARGSVKCTGKAKWAKIKARTYNTLFFNNQVTTGMTLVALNELQSIPSATPYTVTVANGATFSQDLGVVDFVTGKEYTRVASNPTAGQYTLNAATGTYTFAAADTGKQVVHCYLYTNATRGYSVSLSNQLMGVAPTYMGIFSGIFGGKQTNLILNCLTSSKLNFIGTKTEDFSIPEVDFDASVNDANILGLLSTDE